MPFIPLSCLITMTKTSNTVLNRNGESDHPYFVVDFRGKAFSFAPLSEMLAVDLTSVQFSCSVMPDSLQLHGLQHARLPCPLPTPKACSNSRLLSWWCHPTISSSAVPFSSCLQCRGIKVCSLGQKGGPQTWQWLCLPGAAPFAPLQVLTRECSLLNALQANLSKSRLPWGPYLWC